MKQGVQTQQDEKPCHSDVGIQCNFDIGKPIRASTPQCDDLVRSMNDDNDLLEDSEQTEETSIFSTLQDTTCTDQR